MVAISIVGSVAWFVIAVMTWIGLPGLFLLMAVEAFGIPPLPSEVILPFAGFLVAEGTFELVPTVVVALAGGLVGAFAAYAAGRWGRDWFAHEDRHPLIRLDPRALDRVDRWFQTRGELTVALTRLVPVIRSYISYPAGFARMHPARFGAYTLLGYTPFALAFLYLGIRLQADWTIIESYFGVLDVVLGVLVVALLVYLVLVATDRVTWGWPPRRRRPDPGPAPGSGAPLPPHRP